MPSCLTQRSYTGLQDAAAMLQLAADSANRNLHVIDLPYRFSSWALDDPENAMLWVDDSGMLRGWAVMQAPFGAIDYACHPEDEQQLHPRILNWAARQALNRLPTGSSQAWFVMVPGEQPARRRSLEAAGFADQWDAPQDPWRKVWLRHRGPTALPPAPSPPGYRIRPLGGSAEAPAYVELHRTVFESRNMTLAWRLRTLLQPAYRPELDLVAETHAGQLAAFCVGWLSVVQGVLCGQVEPLGVHPDHRGAGLGREILCQAVANMYRAGAARVFVETDGYRGAALGLYEAAGFALDREVHVFRKDFHKG